MGRHKLGIAAAVAALLALASLWPGGGPPAGTPTATEPTASAADPPASEDGDEAEDTGTPAAPSSAPSEPASPPASSAAPTTAAPPASASEPAGGAYGGPLGTRNRTGSDAVALTFDDGPSPEWTPTILAMLRERGIKATFCMIGAYAEAHPELVADIAREGHTLCNHTWFHEFDLGARSEGEIRANLQRTNDAIAKAVPGAEIGFFRHPGGQWTDRAIAVAADLGMESLHWAVDPSDWDEATTEAQIRERVVDRTGPGAVVLLHDGASNQRDLCGALESIFAEFERRGYAYTAL
ncbi:polysaccharide deacetylase family protein [Glycomyces sp. TRM65418]|uniref:polysaccharide deacetylase family protein n=1 Tax=Glycomyces sp. TRM65418 TaxID=2867006 RepID=UPI001CE62EFB|nr:polysaccharide deacetylase family protein [Glycomyces sp. TRM65418]MCC3762756.1 polysaccharide deacetylase family protein [Glycomyces sp. TRM65418]QZD56787.1 polysaccharide deacetylase family protein [Glycomyces sp. TRM65418]